jgi:TusA-related sulfurtransferase
MSKRSTVDARKAFCPGPMMELIAELKKMEVGDEVEVLSRDKGSANDIPIWTKKVGHELVSNDKIDDYWSIVVKKMK